MTTLFSAFMQYQLALLQVYEDNLTHVFMDEAQLNNALREWLLSLQPLMAAQRRLNEQMLAAHREGIAQYRSLLQAMSAMTGPAVP